MKNQQIPKTPERAEHPDLVVFEGDLFTGPLAADAEQLLEHRVDGVGAGGGHLSHGCCLWRFARALQPVDSLRQQLHLVAFAQ